MAHAQMSLKGRAFTASTAAPRPSTRCIAARAVSREQQVPLMDRLAPTMLAGLVTLSAGFTMFDASFAPPARADEEMTPYEKRQAELERRRELLREAREKAAARAAGETYTPPEPAAAPAPAAPAAPKLNNSLQSYQEATKSSPSLPAAPKEPEAPAAPAFGGFSWSKRAAAPAKAPEPAAAPAKTESSSSDMGSMFSSDMWNTPIKPKAAAPEAPAPAPAPTPFKAPEAPKPRAPEPVKKAEPVKAKAEPVKKAEPAKKAEATKPGKRRGPLPLWFAEILVLGAYAGLFLAITKYSQQSGEVLKAVWGKIVEAYNAVEKLVGKKAAA